MPNDALRRSDGQFSWLAGVNSDLPRTKRIGGILDDGLLPNQASWLMNCVTRGGGIGQRHTLHPIVQGAIPNGLFQGGFLYQPDYGDPILIVAVGGRLYRIRVDLSSPTVTDLNALYSVVPLPADAPLFHFEQAEMFLIVQVGDFVTKPLFYDFGAEGIRPESLRQSAGIIGVGNPGNELPPSGPMSYYANRLWYAFARGYAAGDIAGNKTSGNVAYDYRDSVLKVTENAVAYGGDAFRIPTNAGDIRALSFSANIDSQLGSSQLYVFTRRKVFACTAPVTRTEWTAATADAAPLQKVALDKGGSYSDRSVVQVNGDLFFASPPNGDVRTIATAQRQWNTWGSVPISSNINRALQFNDRSILAYTSGINFDNFYLQTILPFSIPGIGTGFQAIAPLDFDTISTLEERRPPSWAGVWDLSGGPFPMQLFEGDFGGRERAFAVMYSPIRGALEIWEFRPDLRFDGGTGAETSGDRVGRVMEFPAYAFGDPFELKQLTSAEIWADKGLGTIDFEAYYRPDGAACWNFWHAWQVCAARNCLEDPDQQCSGYPEVRYCEQDFTTMVLPKPPVSTSATVLPCPPANSRRADFGYQFQMRLIVRGWCRIRGVILYANGRDKRPYAGIMNPPTSRASLPLQIP